MTTLESLLTAACKTPKEGTVRGVLADCLRENGESELGAAIEDAESGPSLLRALKKLAKAVRLPLTVHLLWCQFNVLARMQPVQPMPLSEPEDDPIEMTPTVSDYDYRDAEGGWQQAYGSYRDRNWGRWLPGTSIGDAFDEYDYARGT